MLVEFREKLKPIDSGIQISTDDPNYISLIINTLKKLIVWKTRNLHNHEIPEKQSSTNRYLRIVFFTRLIMLVGNRNLILKH